jgi:hypothetical protein
LINISDEKDKLIKELSEQYAQNILTLLEYEQALGYVTSASNIKELSTVKKAILENTPDEADMNSRLALLDKKTNFVTVFSHRSTNVKTLKGNAGKYTCVLGYNKIIVDHLPKGKTHININSIAGLTELIVPKNVKIINKITPVFSGVFFDNEINELSNYEDMPELYITGKAVFGNVTIKLAKSKK